MDIIKLAIIYYSKSGTNYQLARWAEEAALEAGAEVRLLKVAETAPKEVVESVAHWQELTEKTAHIPQASTDDLEWADALLFSTPTRFGNMAAQMRQFLDTTGGLQAKGALRDKPVSAMTSAGNIHGGHESTLLSLYNSMYHWGAIIVPNGYTDPSIVKSGGNPYGASVTVDKNGDMIEDVQPAVAHQTRRLLEITRRLIRGKEA